ncbi:hypothetical protein HN51_004305 [Arachis hypogaea]
MAWRNGCEEVAQSKPLFLTIYTVVIIGIVVSFFYVFSAIYSSNNLLSSPSTVSSSFSHDNQPPRDQTLNISQPEVIHNVPPPSLTVSMGCSSIRQKDARFGDFPTDQRAGSAKGER